MADSSSTTIMKGGDDKATSETSKNTKKRVRKQRKVIRKETTKNEKGYRVTRDVEGWESYSSDESEGDDRNISAPKKSESSKDVQTKGPSASESLTQTAQAPKKATPAATGGQRKLSTFFSKKSSGKIRYMASDDKH